MSAKARADLAKLGQRYETPWETTELRVIPLRVGVGVGVSDLHARLASASEAQPFIVKATPELARVLGGALRMQVDVELSVCRDVNGNIEDGRVTAVHEVIDANPATVWRAWFEEQADGWDDADLPSYD
jgi:hypothetical protein